MRTPILIIIILTVIRCGSNDGTVRQTESNPRIPVSETEVVVKSRATFSVSTPKVASRGALNGTQPVSVTNSPSASMVLDNSLFVLPAISNELLDFGYLVISSLNDNDLKVCGSSGNKKCGTALIRIYTNGVAGPGLYNSLDDYGAPITAILNSPLTVGLGAPDSAVMQSFSIPNTKHTIKLADFTPAPKYGFKIDFTNAGAGNYSTNIVVEYALAP